MMLEIYRDGVKWMTVHSVGIGSEEDVMILPKRLVKGGQLSAESFENIFFSYVKDTNTYQEAYERTESLHEEWFDNRKYSSYDSFRVSKDRKFK